MNYFRAVGEPFLGNLKFYEEDLGIVKIPLKYFDGVASSDATSIFDGLEENYIGEPLTLEWFGILSLGRFSKKSKEPFDFHRKTIVARKPRILDTGRRATAVRRFLPSSLFVLFLILPLKPFPYTQSQIGENSYSRYLSTTF